MAAVEDILFESHEDRLGRVESNLVELTNQALPLLARLEERVDGVSSSLSRIEEKLDSINGLDQRLTAAEGSWGRVKTVGKWIGAVAATVVAGITVHLLSR